MKGIQFLIDEKGKKTAVLIDLKTHARLWEDLYDAAVARQRESEPRESLEAVKKRSAQQGNCVEMNGYTIVFARSARKELEALSPDLIARILSRVESLATAPRAPGCRKLQGERDLWRIRIGDYRVIYSIDDEHRTVDVNAVRHRREAYQ